MMTPKRRKRLTLIVLMVAGIAIAAGFALKAFNENLMFFYTPSNVAAGEAPVGHPIRVGGLVTALDPILRNSGGTWIGTTLSRW